MQNVNIERIEKDLYELAKFGYNEHDKGIYRPGLTPIDMESRKWLLKSFEEMGLTASMDGAGNVFGRLGDPDKPAILIGSHTDSVPCGGMFDGCLGVVAGMECVRVIQEQKLAIKHPIEIVATSEEEGRFGGMFGSQAIVGDLTHAWVENAATMDGERLSDALLKCGLTPEDALRARRDPESMLAFLELHIEQGPVLETKQKSIGIVDTISGVWKWMIRLIGKADHAGTAPMDMRSDAFMGLADFAHEIHRIIDEEGTDRSRLTIGKVGLKPGFAHTIPGEVDFTLVGRDTDEEVMRQLANACRRVLSSIARRHRLMFEYEEKSWLAPQDCSSQMVQLMEKKAKNLGLDYMVMPSGAGHDVQMFSKLVPSGLIFVPSVNGVSHAPDEWTHWIDIEKGANLLLGVVLDIARNPSPF